MLNFCQKSKGAISVFLVIILLPMMLFSWLLIDSARVKLAYSRVVDATDLTLNTALSNYDNILKDMYGLFSMSQTADELFDNLEEYYTKNLMIAGLDEDDAAALSENIVYNLMNYSEGEPEYPYSDFISLELNSFDWSTNPKSSLANPEIMKDQMVNFMKYRAPLGLGMKLIDIIKSFKTVDEQAKVIEDKTKYYESQSKLEQHLRNAWGYIEQYRAMYMGADAPLTSTKIKEFEGKFDRSAHPEDSFIGRFEQHIARPIAFELLMLKPTNDPGNSKAAGDKKNLKNWAFEYYTEPFPISVIKVADKEYSISIDGATYIIDTNKTVSDDDEIEIPLQKDIEKINNIYFTYQSRFDSKMNGSDKELSNIFLEGDSGLQIYDGLSTFHEKMMFKANVLRTLVEGRGIDLFKNDLKEYFQFLSKYNDFYAKNNLFGAMPDEDKPNHTQFIRYIQHFYELFDKKSDEYPSTFNANGAYENVIKPIQEMYSNLSKAYTLLNSAKDELDKAIKEMDTAEARRKDWNTSANAAEIKGTSFSNDNIQEASAVEKKFSKDDIQKLKDLIVVKMNTISGTSNGNKGLTTQLEDIKFYGTSITSTELGSLYLYYKLYVDKSGFESSGNKGYRESVFQDDYDAILNNIKSLEKDGFKYDYKPEDGRSIEFNNPGPLYNYMSNVYKGAGDSNKKTVEEDSKEGKESKSQLNDQKNDLKNPSVPDEKENNSAFKYDKSILENLDNTFPSKADLSSLENEVKFGDFGDVGNPSEEKGDDGWKNTTNAMDGAGDKTKDFFGSIFAAMENALEDVRDGIYIEEYIMGMFSYRTLEKEKFIEEYEDIIGKDLSVADMFKYTNFYLYDNNGNVLNNNYGINLSSLSNLSSKFDRDDLIGKIETLTNIPMSPANNVQYLNEVEYIIYGTGSSESVANTIFALRFILNTISAFMNSELRSVARTIAMAIFGYPPLTFLVPIAQIAIIIACAIGESIIDKSLILGGFSVPVFKSKDNFICSPRGLVKQGTKAVMNKLNTEVKKGISYAKGKVDECVTWLNNKANSAINQGGEAAKQKLNGELKGALESAYDEKVGDYVNSVTDALLDLAQQYLTIEQMESENTDGQVIDYDKVADNILKSIRDYLGMSSLDKGSIEYKIKDAACSIIEKKGKDFIQPVIKALDNSIEHSKSELIDDQNLGDDLDSLVKSKSPIISIPASIKKAVLDTLDGKANNLVDSSINTAMDGIRGLKDNAVKGVMDYADKGAKELEKAADNFFDNISDKISNKLGDEATSLSSDSGKTIQLGYSGYLRLFLLIALIADPNGVLKRTGDIIQLNMRKLENNTSYTLTKSYTFIDIDVNSEIKPLFFSFEGVDRLLGKEGNDFGLGLRNMYKIHYKERSGY